MLTAGLGGMGGAQPLAATMHGAAVLGIEVDESRIDKRIATRLLRPQDARPRRGAGVDRAARRTRKQALSVGLVGNAAEVLPELVRRGVMPDVLTDQTSAHDTLNGYVPAGLSLERGGGAARGAIPPSTSRAPTASIAEHVRAMLEMQERGAVTFDYGNNIRTVALRRGLADAFEIPGFVPEYIRPLFCEGKGPFRWVALSGDPSGHRPHRRARARAVPARRAPAALDHARARAHPLPGAAGAHLLAGAGRPRAASASRSTTSSRAASSRRRSSSGATTWTRAAWRRRSARPEAMKDGSDAIADWAILNALLNVASGASWVSFHHGGGVGIGNSLHAGQVIVADGTPEMRVRLERVLTNDPGIGVARHADAGYETAIETARRTGITLPMAGGSQRALRHATVPWHVPLFLAKYAWLTARRMPVLVHFEVTMRCNARCGFCDYWKTDPAAKATELTSFADAARLFNPMLVTFTGGEPTLRRDLEDLVAGGRPAPSTCVHHAASRTAAMLTPERARRSGTRASTSSTSRSTTSTGGTTPRAASRG